MDAFFKRQLFAQDVMVLIGESNEQDDDTKNVYKTLQDLVKDHGGVVVDQQNSDNRASQANIVLSTRRNQQDLNLLQRQYPSAAIVHLQWVTDSIQKNQRLAITSYRVLEQTNAFSRTESPAMKKQKVPTAVIAAARNATTTCLDDITTKPHIRPWRIIRGSLYVLDARAQTQHEEQVRDRTYKIAGFDLDWTLIVTKSGKNYPRNQDDWKWFHPTLVKDKLNELARDGFTLVIFSNQNGVAKGHITAACLQHKLETIVKQLNLPVLVFLATENDMMRKPRLGAWTELVKLLSAEGKNAIDEEASFYCGDAAGRPKTVGRSKDFAASDYKFALNAGISFYTPEDLFLGTKQRIHTRPEMWEIGFDPKSIAMNKSADPVLISASAQSIKEEQELIVLVGPPASGKSFFADRYLSSYVRVSQDELRTVAVCKKKCLEAIGQKKSVVVDNTNCDLRARKEWIVIAKEKNLPIRCFEMDVSKSLSMHLNTFRLLTEQKKIPDIAIHRFYKTFVPPTVTEGFAEVVKVPFRIDKNISDVNQALLLSYIR